MGVEIQSVILETDKSSVHEINCWNYPFYAVILLCLLAVTKRRVEDGRSVHLWPKAFLYAGSSDGTNMLKLSQAQLGV
jgi:hypothetical protein